MNDKIKTALFDSPKPDAEPANESQQEPTQDAPFALSETEQNLYYHIKNLFKKYVNLEDITYKKTESYLAILYKVDMPRHCNRLATDPDPAEPG